MKKIDNNSDFEMRCKETIRQIVEELKSCYPNKENIL